MLDGFLTSFNIGNAKVYTILDTTEVTQGETVYGTVRLYSGNVAQEITEIYLYLICLPKIGDTIFYQEKDIWQTVKIGSVGVLQPGEVRDIPFELKIPDNMPVLWKDTYFHTYIQTGLNIKRVIDPKDEAQIKILPDRSVRLVLDILKELNIRPYDIGQTYNDDGGFHPYYQFLYFQVPHPIHRTEDSFKITYLGKGEFVWRGFKFQVTEDDLADGGQQLKKFITEELAHQAMDLVVQTLGRLDLYVKTLTDDHTELLFFIPEEYQPNLAEVYLSYLGEKHFQLRIISQNVGDLLNLSDSKMTFTVKPSDLEDQGQRLESLFRDIFSPFA